MKNMEVVYSDDFSIKSLGIQNIEVYDLEVENNHNFFANDILVHNSVYLQLNQLVMKAFPNKSTQEIVDLLDQFSKKFIQKEINEACEEIFKYTNAYKQAMFMKRECIAERGIWTGKKHYILKVWDSEGVRYDSPKYKIMGMEAVKSSTPEYLRDKLRESYKIMIDGTESELQNFIEKIRKEFNELTFEEISCPRGVKGIDKYKDGDGYKKGVPIHVRGALVYNKLLKQLNLHKKYDIIKNGDKIKFCYMKLPNPFKENIIACLDYLPSELQYINTYIDYNEQFEKTFIQPLTSILDVIKWSVRKKKSLLKR